MHSATIWWRRECCLFGPFYSYGRCETGQTFKVGTDLRLPARGITSLDGARRKANTWYLQPTGYFMTRDIYLGTSLSVTVAVVADLSHQRSAAVPCQKRL